MLVLVMLIGTLVACKEPEKTEHGKGSVPVGGESSASIALPEIIGLWIEANSFGGEDILAWDMDFGYVQGENSNLSITFKGAITKNDNEDFFELSVVDNKSASEDKTVLGVIIDNDALYLSFSGSTMKLPELSISSLAIAAGTEEDFNSTLTTILDLIGVVAGLADDGTSTVAITKGADGKYTKEYNLSIDIWAFLEDLELQDLLSKLLKDENGVPQVELANQIVDAIAGVLEGNVVKINATVTDMTLEEKFDEEEEDIYYYYKLVGGKVSPSSISVGLKDSEGKMHDIAISGLEIISTMPTLTVPTENVQEISILKHQITGNFTMKNNTPAEGVTNTVVSDYTYSINVEFSADDIIGTIAKCIVDKSADPLIEQLFRNQDGKLFIDVYHTCVPGCVNHLSADDFEGSILTIAYDPAEEAFNNNSVYVSAHLKAIIPDSIFAAVGLPAELTEAISLAIPDMISFIIDPLLFYDMENGSTSAATQSSLVEEGEKTPIDIGKLITDVIATITTPNGFVEIDFTAIKEVLFGALELDEATKTMIDGIMDSIFPDVTTLSINAVYANGAQLPEDFNGMTEFMKLNENTTKKFATLPFGLGKMTPMTGEYNYTNVIDANNIKITSDILYNADGVQNPITHAEFMALLSAKDDTSSKARVKATYVGTDGKTYNSDFRIIGVKGLNPKIINEPQTVNLVLSRGSGASVFTLLDILGGILGESVPAVAFLNNIFMPEAMVQTTVTLRDLQSEVWSQAGIGSDDNHIDSAKEYTHNDEIVTQFNFTRTFSGGVTEVYTANPTNDIFNTMNADTKTSTFKVYADATLNYSAKNGKYTHEVAINFDEASVVSTEAINDKYTKDEIRFTKDILNNATNKYLTLTEANAKSIMDAFLITYPDVAEYAIEKEGNSFKAVVLTFKKTGEYNLTINGTAGDSIVYTITINENVIADTIYDGDTLVNEPKTAYLNVPIAIGLIQTDIYSSGLKIDTIITEFTSIKKGVNLEEDAVLGEDYTINAETGEVTFLIANSYAFNLKVGEATYTVHFNAEKDVITTTYDGANESTDPITAYTDAFGYSVSSIITKVDSCNTADDVRTIIAEGYVVTLGGGTAVLDTNYTISASGELKFKSAGNYIFSYTVDADTYLVHYTVIADEVATTVVTGNETTNVAVGGNATVVITSTITYLSGETSVEKSKSGTAFTVTGTVGTENTTPVAGTDYAFQKYVGKNKITFKTAGTYTVSCTLNGEVVSITYTVTAAA